MDNNFEQYTRKYGLEIPEKYVFSKKNLIIGKNGSGKTRLLKACRDFYTEKKMHSVIYIYFPHLSDKYSKEFEEKDIENALFDISESDYDMSYDDFVTAFEYTGVSYLKSCIEDLNARGSKRKKTAERKIEQIKSNLKLFLDAEIEISEEKIMCSRNGREREILDTLSELSPGELNLFYITLFLSLASNEKKYVLFLDEPEVHLHPDIIIKFFQTISSFSNVEEIWIATHSPFLLQEFSFNEITLISDSKVQLRNSSLYKNILYEMLGKDERKISDLFKSVDEWEFCEFIAECFLAPTVVSNANAKDEQARMFMKCCASMAETNLRILDWGGGSGRLGKCMELIKQSEKVKICYQYEIYQPKFDTSVEVSPDFISYDDENKITSTYDCIVLMNVLHEVDINSWKETFNKISDHICEDGKLCFAEAKVLSIGEQPYCENGYIVLGKEQLYKLFKAKKNDIVSIHIKDGEQEKTECHLISPGVLKNVDDSSIHDALCSLRDETLIKLRQMDKERISHVKEEKKLSFTYRKYAFFMQQYVNAVLALDKMQLNVGNDKECKGNAVTVIRPHGIR